MNNYIPRLNKIIHFIDKNIGKDLNIDMLANMAHFSKFYFCRVFKSYTGESVYGYIKRNRVERSFYLLWNSNDSIKVIAQRCGFNSVSNFSYNFKKYFGISATEQREMNKEYKKHDTSKLNNNLKVNIIHEKPKTLAFLKSFGSYEMDTFKIENKLYNWAKSRGFWKDRTKFQRINYDSIYVTKEEYFQTDICVEVPKGTMSSEDISIMEIPERMLAVLEVSCTASKELLLGPLDELNIWILSSAYKNATDSPGIIYHDRRNNKNINKRLKETLNFQVCFPVVYK